MSYHLYVRNILLALILLGSIACGEATESGLPPGSTQITEAGNPPASPLPKKPRLIQGLFEAESDGSCPITSVVSIDTAGFAKEAELDEQCAFSMEIASNKAWFLKFKVGSAITAQAYFKNGNLTRPVYFLSDSPGPVDFGVISLQGNKALPSSEATWQNDADNDGMSDFQDPDDDNDGILDGAESDCDLDGVIDDYEPQGKCE